MTLPKFTIEQTAEMFGVSIQRIKDQYLANAKGLQQMLDKAVKTGKKVNNYTKEQLKEMVAKYNDLAK